MSIENGADYLDSVPSKEPQRLRHGPLPSWKIAMSLHGVEQDFSSGAPGKPDFGLLGQSPAEKLLSNRLQPLRYRVSLKHRFVELWEYSTATLIFPVSGSLALPKCRPPLRGISQDYQEKHGSRTALAFRRVAQEK